MCELQPAREKKIGVNLSPAIYGQMKMELGIFEGWVTSQVKLGSFFPPPSIL